MNDTETTPSAKPSRLRRLFGTAWRTFRADMRRFYSRTNLLRFGIAFLVANILANLPPPSESTFDQRFSDWYQQHVRNESAEKIHRITKHVGDGPTAMVTGVSALVIGGLYSPTLWCWGVQMARGFAVAMPALGITQQLTGGSRPEKNLGSYWRPFSSLTQSRGISGHAMAGALPFLIAAEMVPHPAVKAALYLGSGLTGVSRINSNSHYFSQVLLGWWLAFLTVRIIRQNPTTPEDN
jgi:membrane-associated phospholipid phosphatase